MTESHWWSPLLGVAFVVFAVVSFIVAGEPPDVDEGAQEALDFYVDNDVSVAVGSALEGIAALLLVFFGGVLRSRLRAVEGSTGTLSAVAFAGTIILAVGLAIDATINVALADAADDIDPVSAHTLLALWQNDFVPLALGLLTFLIATGGAIIRTGILPKWLGWIAIVIAIFGPTPAGFVAFFGAALFILVISVMLAMRERNATPSTPTSPPPPPPTAP